MFQWEENDIEMAMEHLYMTLQNGITPNAAMRDRFSRVTNGLILSQGMRMDAAVSAAVIESVGAYLDWMKDIRLGKRKRKPRGAANLESLMKQEKDATYAYTMANIGRRLSIDGFMGDADGSYRILKDSDSLHLMSYRELGTIQYHRAQATAREYLNDETRATFLARILSIPCETNDISVKICREGLDARLVNNRRPSLATPMFMERLAFMDLDAAESMSASQQKWLDDMLTGISTPGLRDFLSYHRDIGTRDIAAELVEIFNKAEPLLKGRDTIAFSIDKGYMKHHIEESRDGLIAYL